jgi:hypothetical protein
MKTNIKKLISNNKLKTIDVIDRNKNATYLYGDGDVMDELVKKYKYKICIVKRNNKSNKHYFVRYGEKLLDIKEYYNWYCGTFETNYRFFILLKSKNDFRQYMAHKLEELSYQLNTKTINVDATTNIISNLIQIKKHIDKGNVVIVEHNTAEIEQVFNKDVKINKYPSADETYDYILAIEILKLNQ